MKHLGKHFTIILKEMCDRVNVSFDIVNSDPNWFVLCEWTEEQESDFKKWLVKYLQQNREARKELFGYGYYILKKRLIKEVDYFTFQWGWKLK